MGLLGRRQGPGRAHRWIPQEEPRLDPGGHCPGHTATPTTETQTRTCVLALQDQPLQWPRAQAPNQSHGSPFSPSLQAGGLSRCPADALEAAPGSPRAHLGLKPICLG